MSEVAREWATPGALRTIADCLQGEEWPLGAFIVREAAAEIEVLRSALSRIADMASVDCEVAPQYAREALEWRPSA